MSEDIGPDLSVTELNLMAERDDLRARLAAAEADLNETMTGDNWRSRALAAEARFQLPMAREVAELRTKVATYDDDLRQALATRDALGEALRELKSSTMIPFGQDAEQKAYAAIDKARAALARWEKERGG